MIFCGFLVLHGLIHLLYFGQSAGYFELQPGLVWPQGSWAFSRLLGNEATRNLASILLVLTALGLIAGAIGALVGQAWWRPVIIGSTVFSAVVFILLWDGMAQSLDSKGGVGLLIDVAILVALLVLRWSPKFSIVPPNVV
jgi:hypothetical protein